MRISSGEYHLEGGQHGGSNSDLLSLVALRNMDGLELGKISLKILSIPSQTAQLSKICTYYPKSLWPPQARDYGGNGIATKLLLEGAVLLNQRSIVHLTGIFAPDKDLYLTKDWYEKRGIYVTEDLSAITGLVSVVIAKCHSIIDQHGG